MQKLKSLYWIGGAKGELLGFPKELVHDFGAALEAVQRGASLAAGHGKTLFGFTPNVQEILDRDRSGEYRVVFTIGFRNAVYVLHCFQKKSKKGIATPRQDLQTINERLSLARHHYEENR